VIGSGGFLASAKVYLGVDDSEMAKVPAAVDMFRAQVGRLPGTLTEVEAAQADVNLKLREYARVVAQSGAASEEAIRANISLSASQRELAASTKASTAERGNALNLFSKEERGALAASGAFNHLGRAVAFASTAFLGGYGLIAVLKSAVGSAEQSQAAQTQLRAALTDSGLSWGTYGGQIDAALKKTQQLSGFNDDELTTSLTALVRRYGDVSKALQVLSIATNVARARNEDLGVATKQIMQASFGTTTSLRTLGIQVATVTTNQALLRDTTKHATVEQIANAKALDQQSTSLEVIDQLQKKYGGDASTYMKSAAGAQAGFAAALDDTKQEIGKGVLPQITLLLRSGTSWLEQTKNQKAIQKDANTVLKDAGQIIHGVEGAIHDISPVIKAVVHDLGGLKQTVEDVFIVSMLAKIAKVVKGFAPLQQAIRATRTIFETEALKEVASLNTVGVAATKTATDVTGIGVAATATETPVAVAAASDETQLRALGSVAVTTSGAVTAASAVITTSGTPTSSGAKVAEETKVAEADAKSLGLGSLAAIAARGGLKTGGAVLTKLAKFGKKGVEIATVLTALTDFMKTNTTTASGPNRYSGPQGWSNLIKDAEGGHLGTILGDLGGTALNFGSQVLHTATFGLLGSANGPVKSSGTTPTPGQGTPAKLDWTDIFGPIQQGWLNKAGLDELYRKGRLDASVYRAGLALISNLNPETTTPHGNPAATTVAASAAASAAAAAARQPAFSEIPPETLVGAEANQKPGSAGDLSDLKALASWYDQARTKASKLAKQATAAGNVTQAKSYEQMYADLGNEYWATESQIASYAKQATTKANARPTLDQILSPSTRTRTANAVAAAAGAAPVTATTTTSGGTPAQTPVFTSEGQYSAAYAQNKKYAVAPPKSGGVGPYQTKLTPAQELQFRQWVKTNKINFDPDAKIVDYDMRGYWLATGGKVPNVHERGGLGYPDTFKTPYDTTFSNQSKYATKSNPLVWKGDNLVNTKTGELVFGKATKGTAGKTTTTLGGGVKPLEAERAAYETDIKELKAYEDAAGRTGNQKAAAAGYIATITKTIAGITKKLNPKASAATDPALQQANDELDAAEEQLARAKADGAGTTGSLAAKIAALTKKRDAIVLANLEQLQTTLTADVVATSDPKTKDALIKKLTSVDNQITKLKTPAATKATEDPKLAAAQIAADKAQIAYDNVKAAGGAGAFDANAKLETKLAALAKLRTDARIAALKKEEAVYRGELTPGQTTAQQRPIYDKISAVAGTIAALKNPSQTTGLQERDIVPYALYESVLKARATTSIAGLLPQIGADQNLQKYLQGYITDRKDHSEPQIEAATKLLDSTDKTLKSLLIEAHKNNLLTAQQVEQFVTLRGTIFSQFAPGIFGRNPAGQLTVGPLTPSKPITVNHYHHAVGRSSLIDPDPTGKLHAVAARAALDS
jgi:hypothetical protein